MAAGVLTACCWLAACADADADLRRLVPADATAVAVVNVPALLDNIGMDRNDLKLPQPLHDVVGTNDDSPLCMALAKLSRLGIDADSHIYAFMPASGPLAQVVLVALNDAEAAQTTIERMTGGDFADAGSDVIALATGQLVCAIKGKTLLAARTARTGDAGALTAEAAAVLSGTRDQLPDDGSPMALAAGNDDALAAACVTPAALARLLDASDAYARAIAVAPVIQLFTESDIDNISVTCEAEDHTITTRMDIGSRDGSDYNRLMATILSKPDNSVLRAIPVSMDNIALLSVKGSKIVDLPQVKQMLEMFKQQQYIGRMDLKPIINTIDGPIACGVAADPHLYGVWNAVVAARSNAPQQVLQYITDFGSAYGQRPHEVNGELIYGWDNKMVSIGALGNIVYIKMLDYEQTEGPASDILPLSEAFTDAVTGWYSQVKADHGIGGTVIFTMNDANNARATFTPADNGGNASLELMRLLASVKPDMQFNN